ncbi:helix-turn-helix domain-containing protein [Streptomyces sp. NPDC051773]|uniref:nSTAND1 domain-containing NTPase n=1 Tax=Streptomyces sp. NPDC051773 TaxID=3156682 RepID=UPI00343FCB0D
MGRRESPLDPGAGPVQRFAHQLRALRQTAGGMTYRAMAERVEYSAPTLSEAAAGERLPSLPVVLAYVAVCGGDPEEWERRWQQALEESVQPPQDDAAGAPYSGLARFEPDDRDRFFGRDRLIADLVQLAGAHRFVGVVGTSGSGKSSLLRAGLIPALRRDRPSQDRPAAIRILTPGEHPATEHAHAFIPVEGDADTWVVVDQFEEVYTLCQDATERDRFIGLLLGALDPGRRLRVVIAVRADFYGHCVDHRALADALQKAHLLVRPMSAEELREVIVKPATAHGLTLERALTARIIADVDGQPGALPMMSHALLETWRRRRGKTLTLQAYEAAGGVLGAIAGTAEHVYTNLSSEQAAFARRLLLRLITPGEGAQDSRRPARRTELAGRGAEGDDAALVLDHLARARLVTLDDGTVDLAHEALITAWPRLRTWIDEDRELLHHHRRLTEAATTWLELNRDPGVLYRGSRLASAAQLTRISLSAGEQEFLEASLAAQAADHTAAARSARHRRQAVVILSVLLLLTGTTTVWALREQRAAERQRDVALSRELAVRSDALLSQRPEAAMLLALEGFRQASTVEARGSLLSAYGMYQATEFTGHTASVETVVFGPDGRTLATAGADHSVKLWNTSTEQLLRTLRGHTDTVTAVAFSPDGRTLATTGADHSVKLWNTTTGRETATLTGHTGSVNAVAFSPDGRILATGGSDGTTRLWNMSTRRTVARLAGHDRAVRAVVFSPDGRGAATAGVDGTVRMWDVTSRRTTAVLTGHTDAVGALAFSPDGRILASGGDDSTARLWNVTARRPIAVLRGHRDSVESVAFSPDGRTLATAGADQEIMLWNPHTHRRKHALPRYEDVAMNAVAFSSDGRTLATAGKDGMTRLWNTAIRESTAVLGGENAIRLAFSPDGRTLATTSDLGTVTLWDARLRREPTKLTGHENAAYAVVFSPDGRTLATGGTDRTVRLWDTATHQQIAVLTGHTSTVLAAAFSPDGRTLATGGYDRTVRLWNVAGRRTSAVLKGHSDGIFAVAFSPDGHTLATAGSDRTARLWSVRSRQPGAVLAGHTDAVYTLAFSPDGRTLATAGADRTAKLWNTATHEVTATLTGHTQAISALTFTGDGQTIITGSHDHTLRLWHVTTQRTEAVISSGTDDRIGALALSPDGHTLQTISEGKRRSWLLETRQITQRICRASTIHHWPTLMPDHPGEAICA